MNDFIKLMQIRPQVLESIHGAEPSLAELVAYYYESHDFGVVLGTKRAVKEYFDALCRELTKVNQDYARKIEMNILRDDK